MKTGTSIRRLVLGSITSIFIPYGTGIKHDTLGNTIVPGYPKYVFHLISIFPRDTWGDLDSKLSSNRYVRSALGVKSTLSLNIDLLSDKSAAYPLMKFKSLTKMLLWGMRYRCWMKKELVAIFFMRICKNFFSFESITFWVIEKGSFASILYRFENLRNTSFVLELIRKLVPTKGGSTLKLAVWLFKSS